MFLCWFQQIGLGQLARGGADESEKQEPPQASEPEARPEATRFEKGEEATAVIDPDGSALWSQALLALAQPMRPPPATRSNAGRDFYASTIKKNAAASTMR